MDSIHYRLRPASPEAHLFEVSCTVPAADPAGQRFALPAWIPGSYLVRDFSRHIVTIKAAQGRDGRGAPVALTKIDKHTWQAAAIPSGKPGPITVTCEVYAWDLSVRGAHLDTTHAFFNGTSVFLRVPGQEGRPCEVGHWFPCHGSRKSLPRASASCFISGPPGCWIDPWRA